MNLPEPVKHNASFFAQVNLPRNRTHSSTICPYIYLVSVSPRRVSPAFLSSLSPSHSPSFLPLQPPPDPSVRQATTAPHATQVRTDRTSVCSQRPPLPKATAAAPCAANTPNQPVRLCDCLSSSQQAASVFAKSTKCLPFHTSQRTSKNVHKNLQRTSKKISHHGADEGIREQGQVGRQSRRYHG